MARDGVVQQVPSADLVPGDIVVVTVGDKVPADCRVVKIETATLSVDQAMLTGRTRHDTTRDAIIHHAMLCHSIESSHLSSLAFSSSRLLVFFSPLLLPLYL